MVIFVCAWYFAVHTNCTNSIAFSIQIYYYRIKYIFKEILCCQLTIYQDTESYTINGTLSDTISDITDLILSFSA